MQGFSILQFYLCINPYYKIMKIKTGFGLLLSMMLLASCSQDTSVLSEVNEALDQLSAMGIYDGEWRVDTRSYVVGENRLTVKKDSIEFVLPEEYIVSSGIRLWNDNLSSTLAQELLFLSSSEVEYYGVVQHIHYTWEGSSSNACYSELESLSHNSVGEPVYGVYSFKVRFRDTPYKVDYRIDLLLSDKVTAMYDINTKMWTIMIPLDKIVVVNLKSGKKVNEIKPILPILVFNSTKKIL